MLDDFSRRFGVQDETLHWVKDFLINRCQSVHSDASQSEDVVVERFEIPQGACVRISFFLFSDAIQYGF